MVAEQCVYEKELGKRGNKKRNTTAIHDREVEREQYSEIKQRNRDGIELRNTIWKQRVNRTANQKREPKKRE